MIFGYLAVQKSVSASPKKEVTMNKKSLIYSLIGLMMGSTLAGMVILNPTQAQPPGSRQAPSSPDDSDWGMMHHQQADQHFIQMMIPHHQGAIDMANLALSKAKHPEIKQLSEAIKRDQNREIEQMKAWYKQWYGSEVPASSAHDMGMGMHSGRGMNSRENQRMPMHGCMGMMSTNLQALQTAPDFDKAFIEQMIPHHKMAVMMAGMILDSEHPEMRKLAKSIIQTQSSEIEQMQQWYQNWYR